MKRALIVVPGLAGNGISRFLVDLAKELPAFGVRAELFTLEPLVLGDIPHEDDASADTRFDITSGGLPRGRRFRYKIAPLAVRLARAARRSDIVIAGFEIGPPVVAALLAGRVARRPAVVMVQSYADAELEHYVSGWSNSATKWAYRHLDVAVCAANGLRESVERLGMAPDRARVIQYGIDVERTRRLARTEAPDWLPDGPYALGVGRLAEHKGFDVLIRAHARLLADGLRHHVVVLGEGERRDELESLVAELGVSETVLMPGFEQNPLPVTARAALFCGPSRFEGWGLMLAEALTLGTPVVASKLAGPCDVLANGRFGELVEPGSVDALADAMARHLRDPEPLRAKAADAAENAHRFSVINSAEGYAALLDELVGHPATTRPVSRRGDAVESSSQ